MIDYQSIKEALATALNSDLGTYTSKSGVTVQAIAIINPTRRQVEDWASVTGLECLIVQNPQIGLQLLMDGALGTFSGTVILNQRTQGGPLLVPAQTALMALRGLQHQSLILQPITGTPANERIDAIASVQIPFQFTGMLAE